MHDALKNGFPSFLNEKSLRSAIESVCAKYGTVTSLRILPPSRGPEMQLRCICFVRLDSEPAQTRLTKELDGFNFGSSLAFFADVDEKWTGSAM